MTIHNLTPDANILFASDSITDILGYSAEDVLGRSSFDYFHPDEVPFARSVHSRGILLDKAAVLHYARILSRDGRWISCECCFTIVHDVLVACISIYRRDEKSQRRAIEAPQIRRLFSCSPRDPRYHMLEHLSPKFKASPMEREPRAALILNRFTRTLTVMFATEAVAAILGVPADQVLHKSFYECIRESSLEDACKCLESAKANDSIAYLRFWSRDPRRLEDFEDEEGDDADEGEHEDEQDENSGDTPRMNSDNVDGWNEGVSSSYGQHLPGSRRSSDSEGGGVRLHGQMDVDSPQRPSPPIKIEPDAEMQDGGFTSSVPSAASHTAGSAGFSSTGRTTNSQSSAAWSSPGSTTPRAPRDTSRRQRVIPSVELEAVVSCTSDGLVVILRRARPPIPNLRPPLAPFAFDNGLFAAPWGQQPIRPHYSPEVLYNFRSPYLPQHMPLRENVKAAGGPPLDQLMKSIRDVAVFAWAVVGINGNLASYSRGLPVGESQPADGLPIWDPAASQSSYLGPENQAARRWLNQQLHDGTSSNQGTSAFAGHNAQNTQNTQNTQNAQNRMNNVSVLPEHASCAMGNGNRWPSLAPPQVSSRPHSQTPTYMPIPQARQHLVQAGQMDSVPPPPSRWDEEPNSSGNYQLSSESRHDPTHYPYCW